MNAKSILLSLMLFVSAQLFAQSKQNNFSVAPVKPGWIFAGLAEGNNVAVFIKTPTDTTSYTDGTRIWVLSEFKSKVINKVRYENVESESLEIINFDKKEEKCIQRITYDASKKILERLTCDFEHEMINTFPENIREMILLKARNLFTTK